MVSPQTRRGRYPGLDQTTRWLPARQAPPSSPVVWQRGAFHLHRSAVPMMLASFLLVGAPFLAGAIIDDIFADAVFVALAFAAVWPGIISPIHHELAHAVVARHLDIATRATGYHFGGAYVILHPPSTGVTLRAWIWTLAAGPISNAIIGIAVLSVWWLTSGEWFTAGGLFCMLVATVELTTCFANAVPSQRSDGCAILDALRLARSPIVI